MINSLPIVDDVASNRDGKLSARQRRRMIRNMWSSGCVSMVLFGFAWMMLILMTGVLVPPEGRRINIGAILLGGFWCLWMLSLGGAAMWAAYRLVTTWLDLSMGRVEQGSGVVIWHRGRYRAQVQGRWLSAARELSLGPGDYEIYYLPRTGRVLWAQRLGVVSTSQVKQQILEALALANRFDINALPIYYAGHLGKERWSTLVHAWLTSGLAALFMVAMSVSMVVVNLSDRPSSGGLWFVIIIAAIVILMACVVFWRLVLVTQDVLANKVASQTGTVQRVARTDTRWARYYYRLGGLTFTVSESAYLALVEGWHYRVYYLPRGNRLVAIEPVD